MGVEGCPGRIAAALDAAASERKGAAGGELPAERLVHIAARLLKAPLAAITLVGDDIVCIRSAIGLKTGRLPRKGSFCGAAIAMDSPMVVPDARVDPEFRDSEAVAGEFGIRFYAGVPLRDASGRPVGTLCCMDTSPRPARRIPQGHAGVE
ncbi:MAG: GAF domain-containing protein, partial [Acetobacteraceae bacterium]